MSRHRSSGRPVWLASLTLLLGTLTAVGGGSGGGGGGGSGGGSGGGHPTNTFTDFGSNPGWTGMNNAAGANNFGYSPGTAFAGGAPGEAGGVFGRNAFGAIYSDQFASITVSDSQFQSLEFSTDFSYQLNGPVALGQTFRIGHFNGGDLDNRSFLGLQLEMFENGFRMHSGAIFADGSRDMEISQTTIALPGGFTGNFSVALEQYDALNYRLVSALTSSVVPGGAFCNTNLISRSAFGNGSTNPFSVNSFGFVNPLHTNLFSPAASPTMYIDNAAYSVPEPSSLMALGLGGFTLLFLFDRRRKTEA